MIKLLNCPFCGSPAKIKTGDIYSVKAVSVRCTACGCSTNPIMEGTHMVYHGERNKHFTIKEAAAEAVRIWNAREPQRSPVEKSNVSSLVGMEVPV